MHCDARHFTHNVRCVAVPFRASIQEKVQLSFQRRIVGDVVQSGSCATSSEDAVVRLVLGTVRDAVLQEQCLQFSLVLGILDSLDHGMVANCRDIVGLSGKGNLVVVLDHTAALNGILENAKVLVIELEESDVVENLVLDRKDGGFGALAQSRKFGIDVCGVLYIVDIVQLLGLGGADGQTRPDDTIGVDRGDEEGRLVCRKIENVVAVGEGAAGQVVEVAALSLRWVSGMVEQIGDDGPNDK